MKIDSSHDFLLLFGVSMPFLEGIPAAIEPPSLPLEVAPDFQHARTEGVLDTRPNAQDPPATHVPQPQAASLGATTTVAAVAAAAQVAAAQGNWCVSRGKGCLRSVSARFGVFIFLASALVDSSDLLAHSFPQNYGKLGPRVKAVMVTYRSYQVAGGRL